jgi:prepilin-type N-terminal cleavage/methylation domain-containing protein
MFHPHADRRRAGFTFIELAVVLVILLVALLIFSSTVTGMAKQRTVNRETSLAVAAARNQLETLRAQDFGEVYALFNADPLDDPGGANTAPGAFFSVPGLDATADAPGGMQGEVVLPSFEDPVAGWQLREDVENRALGLPRDLSGDNKVDDQDHSNGYFILPVQIRVRWAGPNGVREYQMNSQLCRYAKI